MTDIGYWHDPFFWICAVIALLVVGISKGGFGGGLGVIAVPLISMVMPAPMAAALMLPLLCCMDLMGLWHFRGKWHWPAVRILVPAAIVGIMIGSFGFEYLAEIHIRLMVGLIAIIFSGRYFWQLSKPYIKGINKETSPQQTRHAGPVSGWFWGIAAGFTSFFAHAGGPPLNVYLLRQGFDKSVYQATSIVFFTCINYIKLIPYILTNQFTQTSLSLSVSLLPIALIGIIAGIWLHKRMSARLFYFLCYIFLMITGLKLIMDWILAHVA